MPELVAQRCHVHLDREAAARCPACGHFFCRECVTEHEERVICTACLKQQTATKKRRRWPLRSMVRSLIAVGGVAWCWLTFVWIGRVLLAMPDKFHEGTLWQISFWDK